MHTLMSGNLAGQQRFRQLATATQDVVNEGGRAFPTGVPLGLVLPEPSPTHAAASQRHALQLPFTRHLAPLR